MAGEIKKSTCLIRKCQIDLDDRPAGFVLCVGCKLWSVFGTISQGVSSGGFAFTCPVRCFVPAGTKSSVTFY